MSSVTKKNARQRLASGTAVAELSAVPPARDVLRLIDPQRAVIVLIAVGALIRIAMAGAFGFGIDESYSVANSRFWAWSYVDYPPLHIWLTGAWAWIWHSESPFVLRLPFVAFFAGSTWLMFRVTSLVFNRRAGFWAALLFNLAPVFALPDASWVLPEGPLAFFLLAGSYVIAKLLFAEVENSRLFREWLSAGALAGLAMLSKYHGMFLLAGVFVFLLSWTPGRPILATRWPWLGALVALTIFLPVLFWNAQHGWIGLFFQSRRVTDSTDLSLMRVVENIGGQAAYLSPWLFVPLAIVWLSALAKGVRSPQTWYFALLASGPILLFTAANIFSRGLPHWTMPGWLFAFPLLGAEIERSEQRWPRLLVYGTGAAALFLLAAFAVLATQANTGWLTRNLPERWAQADPTLDLLDWNQLNDTFAKRKLIDRDISAIGALEWIEAGKLNYAVGRSIPVLCLCQDPQQFRFLHDASSFAGRDMLVIDTKRDFARREITLGHWFDHLERLQPITLSRAGGSGVELVVLRGIGFRPIPR